MQMSRTQTVIDKMENMDVYAAESGMYNKDVYVQVPEKKIGHFFKEARSLDLETDLTRTDNHLVGEVNLTSETLR